MKSIFTYIFKNNYYNDVISKYDEIRQKYLEAYKIWSKYHSVSDNGKFETKEIIASAYSEIKQVDSWKCTYNYLERNKKEEMLSTYNHNSFHKLHTLLFFHYFFLLYYRKRKN